MKIEYHYHVGHVNYDVIFINILVVTIHQMEVICVFASLKYLFCDNSLQLR